MQVRLKLLKVLSSDITKWNQRISCSEVRGVGCNGLWGISSLMNSSLLSLASLLAVDRPFLVIPQRGHPSVLLMSENFFSRTHNLSEFWNYPQTNSTVWKKGSLSWWQEYAFWSSIVTSSNPGFTIYLLFVPRQQILTFLCMTFV